MNSDCFICRKHRGQITLPGGPLYTDDLLFVSHASIDERQETTYLGALLIEPRRHVAGMGDLSDDEARRLGLLASRFSRALMHRAGAEHVYLFVLGHKVDHLHLWLVPRYPGTPREYWGQRVDEWPDAPRGNATEVADLVARLKAAVPATVTD
jgi:histidine triad (HIT) family protein